MILRKALLIACLLFFISGCKKKSKVYFVPIGAAPTAEINDLVSHYKVKFGIQVEVLPAINPGYGDFDGDRKTDVAIFRPSTGEWFILRSEDASYYSVPFGANGDVPAPGDYDGDGKSDTAVFRPTGSTWYVNRSTAGILIQGFGASGDYPASAAFIP